MIKILMAFAIGGAVLAGCSKQKQPPDSGTVSKLISFSIYADPSGNGRDPDKTSASIRLSVIVSSLNNIHSEVVWDTIIPMRNLREFPGPKEPMLFTRMVNLADPDYDLISLTCNKIYQVNQKLETSDHTEGVLPSSLAKIMDIVL